jgi:hypothetical protein
MPSDELLDTGDIAIPLVGEAPDEDEADATDDRDKVVAVLA